MWQPCPPSAALPHGWAADGWVRPHYHHCRYLCAASLPSPGPSCSLPLTWPQPPTCRGLEMGLVHPVLPPMQLRSSRSHGSSRSRSSNMVQVVRETHIKGMCTCALEQQQRHVQVGCTQPACQRGQFPGHTDWGGLKRPIVANGTNGPLAACPLPKSNGTLPVGTGTARQLRSGGT
jgi:hypothetical protein